MDSIKIAKVDDVEIQSAGRVEKGTIHITQHHLIVQSEAINDSEVWIPYPMISLVTRMPLNVDGFYPILIHTRNFRSYTLRFRRAQETVDVFDSIRGLTVATTVTQLYAFFYTPNPSHPTSEGWKLYSPRAEFGRMGVGTRTKAWRFTDINKDYKFCPTYPGRMVVPTKISDATLQYASKYRSKCRIPTLAYLHWANFATITRSSQPMVGLTNNRSIQDEKLIEAIFQSHHSPESRMSIAPVYGATTTNLIIDARPTTNAMANVAKGAGSENMDHYREGRKAYLGIDNIHVMRESLSKVVDALRESDSTTLSALDAVTSEFQKIRSKTSINREALRRSGWLRHLSAILDGTLLIVRNVHVNSSHVLIHCSDGWDRTAQLSSLAQICLDPFYRTMKGLQILVEKDYLSFGHRFMDRCGHLSSDKFFLSTTETPLGGGGSEMAQAIFSTVQNKLVGQGHLKETSPVFHQFLECVRQIQLQHPTRFEYNGRYLETIFYHLYSCQFGTFLSNCERERRTGEGSSPCERTHSVWDLLNTPEEIAENKNELFDPSLDDPSRREGKPDMGVLFPDPKSVRFWHELYGRDDDEMNGFLFAEEEGADMTGPVIDSSGDPIVLATRQSEDELLDEVQSFGKSNRPYASSDFSNADISSLRHSSPWISSSGSLSSPSLPRSKDTTVSAIGATPTNPLSKPAPESGGLWSLDVNQQPELLRGLGGMKSMWGRFSSSASTALTAVQGAYGDMTKEVKGRAASQGWSSGPDTNGKELESRGNSMVDYGDVRKDAEANWATTTKDAETQANSSWASDIQVPTERWKTERVSQSLSSLSLENPWQAQNQPLYSSRSREQETVPALHHNGRPELTDAGVSSRQEAIPSIPSSQIEERSNSDPLGVL